MKSMRVKTKDFVLSFRGNHNGNSLKKLKNNPSNYFCTFAKQKSHKHH